MSRVLVVDDEPGLRQSLGLLLADAGYDVAAEGNGAKALARALAEPFDLVLCDVRMPDMDGLAFLRGYVSGGGSALVIMMSAYGRSEEHTSELQSPCNLVCRLLLEKKKKEISLWPAYSNLDDPVTQAKSLYHTLTDSNRFSYNDDSISHRRTGTGLRSVQSSGWRAR